MNQPSPNSTVAIRSGKPRDLPKAKRPRPAWLRALGKNEPPAEVVVEGTTYRCVELFKHDSWAATALYAATTPNVDAAQIICKFNRVQPLLVLPGAWVGRWLGRREFQFLRRLADTNFVPRVLGAVYVDGRIASNAVARVFIAGHPLGAAERVSDEFFAQLSAALEAVHAHDVAYVDLHKRENVLVGEDGRPYLIDFQVSFGLTSKFWRRLRPARAVLQMLQRMDLYHRDKLHRKCRPDQCPLSNDEFAASRPWLVRAHRFVAQPLRTMRRKLLTVLGVRAGRGKVDSEQFVEAGLRDDHRNAA